MSNMKRQLALVCSIALLGSMAVQAAPVSPMTQQEQLEQARRADEARSERLQRPERMEIEGIPDLEESKPIAPGGPSFFISARYGWKVWNRNLRFFGIKPQNLSIVKWT